METQSILILNGPNLNLLGIRDTSIYGEVSFDEYLMRLKEAYQHINIIHHQTNHEGKLIDLLHEYGFGKVKGIILNAGGYTHTSIALGDAVKAISTPVIEVHISNIENREEFRKVSYLKDPCVKSIIGMGLNGYEEAIKQFIDS